VALGVLYNLSRDYEGAVTAFRVALQTRSTDYSLWNKLGATLANSGRSSDAIDAYQKALELKPNYMRAWVNMGISQVWHTPPLSQASGHPILSSSCLNFLGGCGAGFRSVFIILSRSHSLLTQNSLGVLSTRGFCQTDLLSLSKRTIMFLLAWRAQPATSGAL